jgi:hypothetical protein
MTLSIFLLIISALFRGLDQIIFWDQQKLSWLPEKVFFWDLEFVAIADSFHFYMGMKLICFGLGFYFLPFYPWYIVGGIIFVYYQVFNLFFHIIFKKREYWRWPFFKNLV